MVCNSIGRLISILHRQAQMYLNCALKSLDIGSSEYLFLITLLKEGSMTQEELSAKIMIDKAATARAVKSLEEKGYVTRETHAEDRRAKKVTCTEKAEASRQQIQEALESWTEFLTEGMDASTQALLMTTLERMTEKARHADYKEMNNKEKRNGSFKTAGGGKDQQAADQVFRTGHHRHAGERPL